MRAVVSSATVGTSCAQFSNVLASLPDPNPDPNPNPNPNPNQNLNPNSNQFNNVLASLLHGLALSRLLCRTLLLPGFFVRFGARLTRVSNFEAR